MTALSGPDGCLRMGCTDRSRKPGVKGRFQVLFPWGARLGKGQYAYRSKSDEFTTICPCEGRGNILAEARARLKARDSEPLSRLVVNLDPDTHADGTSAASTGLKRDDLTAIIQNEFDPSATINSDEEIEIDKGETRVSLVRWEVFDPPAPGLPNQQTLERLVCAAIVATYPGRAKAVQDWLDARPDPPAASPKDHSWSYMAGWNSENSCDFFYQNLWNDASVVAQLESRLRASGARIAELLAT